MTNQEKKITTIKCPHCGYEYVPAEIFMPTDIEGKPDSIVKDVLGKVLYAEYENWNEPEQVAKYICDGCGKPFKVEPVISYRVKKEEAELDFSNTTSSLLDD